mgnify:FL=1|tara:strand:+ start:88 stop:702 length:615 start_codon:yes stop_codon:yes gene_type:complete
MINLTNEDNMELMKRYPDNYFELAIVDPPYGINVNNSMGRRKGEKKSPHKKVDWDNEIPSKEYFIELFRISKNQIIWGGNYFTDYLTPSKCWILFDKLFSEDLTFSQFELAWASFDSMTKKFTYTPARIKRIHPTQKPVKLYEWLLMRYAKEGDKILDTHLGSASIAIACHNLGFDLVGCELDKEYYEAACKRLKRHQQQLTMF